MVVIEGGFLGNFSRDELSARSHLQITESRRDGMAILPPSAPQQEPSKDTIKDDDCKSHLYVKCQTKTENSVDEN